MINRIIFILLFISSTCIAADIHVGPGQTYTTIGAAITASGTYDTIYIHEATYLENNLAPKTGTTLTGVDGEDLPVIDAEQTSSTHDWNNNPFSVINDDITFYRLDVRDGSAGNIVIEDSGIDNIEVSYCRLTRSAMTAAPDNASCLYVKPNTTNITIHHNYFETYTNGFGASIWFEPDGATTSYYNNEARIHASGSGIYIKAAGSSTGRLQIYNNFVVMDYVGSNDASGIYISQDNTDIYNNLIIGNAGRGILISTAGLCGGSGTILNHNTVYLGTAIRGTFSIENDCAATNITFKNNILRRTSTSTEYRNVNAWIYGTTQTWSGDNNLVFQNSAGTSLYETPTSAYTMATWKGTGQGTGSYDEDAAFSNASGNLNLVSDFEIVGGNALNGGDDGEDMGVDVTNVGTGADPENTESTLIGQGTSSTFSTGDSTVIN